MPEVAEHEKKAHNVMTHGRIPFIIVKIILPRTLCTGKIMASLKGHFGPLVMPRELKQGWSGAATDLLFALIIFTVSLAAHSGLASLVRPLLPVRDL